MFIKRDDRNVQIGLDIGSHSVKAAAISYLKTRPQLAGFSVMPLKDNMIRAIKDAYAALGFTKRRVVVSISGPAVIIRYTEMPSMTDDELVNATKFEAEKVIPYNIDDVILDSVKLEDLSAGRMRVVIVAAKKDLVDSQLKILREADLEPAVLDVDSFALMNAFVNTGASSESLCALLNIGAKSSNLNIIKGESSYLCRDLDIGGNDITKAIAEALSIKEKDPDSIKEEKLASFEALAQQEKEAVLNAIAPVLSRIADELRLSFDFYENHYAGSITKVYISGGTAKSPEIAKLLKQDLGCEVSGWDPLANTDVDARLNLNALEALKPQLAIAVGLALRRT